MKEEIIALYIRLSLEDSKYDSMSIENQQMILREKALSLSSGDRAVIREFIDNGHTGTNFERPAMQELLSLVQTGKVACILVKDFSRFGRNSIETGYFIEKVFPLYHTRFISVSDNFDSADYKGDTGGIDVAFKYLINEAYSRDMSMKSKSAKYAKMRRGEYQSVVCCYGYQKGKDGRLVPDQETAPIVRQIFTWAAEGCGAAEISRKLYAQSIPTPGQLRAIRGKPHHDVSRSVGIWSNTTILRMLADEQYIGTYIQGRATVRDIGSDHMRKKDRSEWFILPDHHEPIVSRDLFEVANKNLRRFSLPQKKPRQYPLRGIVYCGYCGHAMSRANNRWFVCRYMKGYDNLGCNGLSIRADELERIVFDSIRCQMEATLGTTAGADDIQLQTQQQIELEKKLQSMRHLKRELYERFVSGELDQDAYLTEKQSCDNELQQIQNTMRMIAVRQQEAQENMETEAIRNEVMSAESLTQAMAEKVIKKVTVFHDHRIEIEYAVQDFLKGGNSVSERAGG